MVGKQIIFHVELEKEVITLNTYRWGRVWWAKEKVLASGPEIKGYLGEVISENKLKEKRFKKKYVYGYFIRYDD